MPPVSATIDVVDGAVIVALDGDLSGPAVLAVECYLAPLLRHRPPKLVVDLSRVRTCDSMGALILDVAARVAADCGGELRLAAPRAKVCRALRQAGTMAVAGTYASVSGALHDDLLDLLATPDRDSHDAATFARVSSAVIDQEG
jgi:anti-anti-sigma factor